MRKTPDRVKGAISEARLLEGRQRLMMNVGDQLERARRRHGVYQREIAERIGVSEAMVSRFMAAPRNMTLATLADMATAMGLDVEVKLRAN